MPFAIVSGSRVLAVSVEFTEYGEGADRVVAALEGDKYTALPPDAVIVVAPSIPHPDDLKADPERYYYDGGEVLEHA